MNVVFLQYIKYTWHSVVHKLYSYRMVSKEIVISLLPKQV